VAHGSDGLVERCKALSSRIELLNTLELTIELLKTRAPDLQGRALLTILKNSAVPDKVWQSLLLAVTIL
jgi:hypothetical protein